MMESNLPDPEVLERLHGLPPPTGPLATTLKMLRARRDHLDMLIALIEIERDLFQGANHERP